MEAWFAFGDYEPNMQVFNFNNATGAITPFFSDNTGLTWPYSCEFSPNSRYLYVGNDNGTSNEILQYDMLAGSSAAILASKTTVATSTAGNYFGAMQIAPDMKIYTGNQGSSTLSVINNPNNPGVSCNFVANSLTPSRRSYLFLGLPIFLSTFFNNSFTYTGTCLGDTTWFTTADQTVDSAFLELRRCFIRHLRYQQPVKSLFIYFPLPIPLPLT